MKLKNQRDKYWGGHSTKRLLAKPADYWAPIFDAKAYMRYNPGLEDALGSDPGKLLEHFILHGMREGRRASEYFDVNEYLEDWPDVKEMYADRKREAYLHYLEHRWERR